MIGIICLFSAGYAAFSSNFLVSGKGTIVQKTITIEELKNKTVDTGDGLYADTYENEKYVYRGSNPNNYIIFNNEMFRIISLDKEREKEKWNLKIMKSESIGNFPFDPIGERDRGSNSGGTYCAYDKYGCNAWSINSSFINGNVSGNVLKDSSLNTYLNGTYYDSLLPESKELVQTHSWNVGPVNHQTDSLQSIINTEKTYVWNGNVGLISVSDYYKANSNIDACGDSKKEDENYANGFCKATNYMFTMTQTATNNYVWMFSPSFDEAHPTWYVFGVSGEIGHISRDANYSENGVLPALYLKSDINLKGSGTETNPYEIVTE